MSKVEISVLLPVYNSQNYVKAAIESILNQTYKNFTLFIINDGSTDHSEEVILSFKDKRIVYIKNETNLGLVASLNLGLEKANGVYIARMDADDISLPNRFEKQINYLERHPEVAVLATKLLMVDEAGKEIGFWNDDFDSVTQKDILINMPKINCIGHPTVMMRNEAIKGFRYNKKFKNSEDWGLWLTLLANGLVIDKLDEVLLKYRVHSGGTIVNANKENVGKRIIRFKRKYILDKLSHFKFKHTDTKVFKYYLRDGLRYYFPFVYSILIKLAGTDLKTLVSQSKKFNTLFNDFPKESRALFFFPFSHLGGAEVVHTEIVDAAAFTKPIVLFTSHTGKKSLLPEFKKTAQILEIDQLIIWPFIKKKIIMKIKNVCEQKKDLILFSSNSAFFYEFVPHIPAHTKAIDLIHAFMHKHEDSSERWSLPVVDKLAERIIINKKTGKDLAFQYSENKISGNLLKRINYISNYTPIQRKPKKIYTGTVKIVFVGRGTAEKRVHLLALAAKILKQKKAPVEFHFVGDLQNSVPTECMQFCILHGEIDNIDKLNAIYSQSHILAMASTREGFPMVIMEAMMNGVIPITTNVGGISQHIVNEQNGILINALEPEDFIKAFTSEVEKLIGDRKMLEELSNNAYNYAFANFNKQQFTDAYIKLFSK